MHARRERLCCLQSPERTSFGSTAAACSACAKVAPAATGTGAAPAGAAATNVAMLAAPDGLACNVPSKASKMAKMALELASVSGLLADDNWQRSIVNCHASCSGG